MSDPQIIVRRTRVIAPEPVQGRSISVALAPSAARISLRVRGEIAGVVAAGLELDGPINRAATAGDTSAARLGPDEWLVVGPEAERDRLQAAIADALKGRFYSLVDISQRNEAFHVGGRAARDVINGACPRDLADGAFPQCAATRTVFGKAEIVLVRPGADAAYRIECWRSYAPYVHGLLKELAREFES